MINHFLASLDNNPTSPGDWVWPVFTARTRSAAAQNWVDSIIGSNIPRELLFRKCLVLDGLVAYSEVAEYRTKIDSRISYTVDDSMSRVRNYGWSVTSSLSAPILTPILIKAPKYNVSVVTAASSSSVSVASSFGTETQSITYTGGVSDPFNLIIGGGITGKFGAAITAGQTWTFSIYQDEDVITNGLKAVRTFGEPFWLPQELLTLYRNLRTDTDKLACVIVGLTL